MAEQFAQEFEAMIDTGFTGFLSIPLTAAFPLALTLYGTFTYQLADGSVSPKLLGWGTVALEDEIAHGTIVLEPNGSGLLLGMDFLKRLDKALVVSKKGVVLIDEPGIAAPTGPEQPVPETTSAPANATPSAENTPSEPAT